MSSSYVGDERASGSSSSRKGKKSNSSKTKQPQRGLGVAQLEKIRLHSQMACGYHPSFQTPYPPNFSTIQEDLRLQTGYSSIPSSSFSYPTSSSSSSASCSLHTNITMGLADYDRTSIRCSDSQSSHFARWDPGNAISERQFFSQASMRTPHHLLNLQEEDLQPKNSKKHRSNSVGSSSQNSESSDSRELDLELRLSL